MLNLIFAEYKKIFSDFGAILILVVAVFLYAFFYPLPYLNEIVKKTPIVVIDDDMTSLSRGLIRSFKQNDLIKVQELKNYFNTSKSDIYDRSVSAIVRIPKDFAKNIYSQKNTQVSVYADASYFLVYRQAFLGLVSSIKTLNAKIEVKKLLAQKQSLKTAMILRDPMPLKVNYLFNPTQGYLTYIFPSVMILILQQTLLIGMGLVRASGQIKHRPKSKEAPIKIFIAKFLAYYFLYMGYLMAYFYPIYNVYDFVLRGHFWDIFAFGSLFLFSSVPLAMLLSYMFRHRESSMQFLLFTSIIVLFLTGFVWPKEAISPILYYPSLLIPATNAIMGFARINQMGASIFDCLQEATILLTTGIIYTKLAYHVLKKDLKKSA